MGVETVLVQVPKAEPEIESEACEFWKECLSGKPLQGERRAEQGQSQVKLSCALRHEGRQSVSLRWPRWPLSGFVTPAVVGLISLVQSLEVKLLTW